MGSHTRRKHPRFRGGSTCFEGSSTALRDDGLGSRVGAQPWCGKTLKDGSTLRLSPQPGGRVAFKVRGRN